MALTKASGAMIQEGTIYNVHINENAAIAKTRLNIITPVDGGNFATGYSLAETGDALDGGSFN